MLQLDIRATFEPTENPELNHVLKTIQDKIVLPAHLPPKQRKMVFDTKQRGRLEQNPVILDIEDLEHKFEPIDRFKDIPNAKKMLRQALSKMETTEDWKNLPILLTGYKQAQIKLSPVEWASTVRKACDSGNVHIILECAKQPEATGLNISHPDIAALLLSFLNDRAVVTNMDAAETTQSLKFCETILDLLARPQHAPATYTAKTDRAENNKLIRGLVLFARLSLLKSEIQAEAATDRLSLLAQDEVDRLTALWGDSHQTSLEELSDITQLLPKQTSAPTDVNLSGFYYTRVVAQNIKALIDAQQLLGSDASKLQPIQKALQEHLAKVVKANSSKAESWGKEYETIVGAAL